MSDREIHVPTFLMSRINEGNALTSNEVLKREVCRAIDAAGNAFGDNADAIVLAIRENRDDDAKIGICVISPVRDNQTVMTIRAAFNLFQPVVIGHNAGIVAVAKRAIKKLIR